MTTNTTRAGETWPAPGVNHGERLPARQSFAEARVAAPGTASEDASGIGDSLVALLQGAVDAIVMADAAGKIVFWNAAATRELGWTAGEVMGRSIAGVVFTLPQQLAEVRRALVLAGQWGGQIATLTNRGEPRALHANVNTSGAKGGAADQWMMTFRPAGAAELGSQAAARLERLEAFARTIDAAAHDLNNAISPFSMSLGLLHARLQNPADAPLLELLETASAHAAGVVEELLNASRQATGRAEAE